MSTDTIVFHTELVTEASELEGGSSVRVVRVPVTPSQSFSHIRVSPCHNCPSTKAHAIIHPDHGHGVGQGTASDKLDLTSSLIRHATRLLVNRPHSTGELRQKLYRVAVRRSPALAPPASEAEAALSPQAATEKAISDLRERGLLDDAAYASWHVEQRVAGSRARSRAQLANELSSKYLSADVAAGAMSAYSDQRAAEAIVDRKSATLSPASLRNHLRWKGFRFDTINSLVPKRG